MSNDRPKIGFASFFASASDDTLPIAKSPPRNSYKATHVTITPVVKEVKVKSSKDTTKDSRSFKCVKDADLDKSHKGKPIFRYGTVRHSVATLMIGHDIYRSTIAQC